MAGLFEITRADKNRDSAIAKKSKMANKTVVTVKGGNSLLDRISQIQAIVQKNLGKFADESMLITTREDLRKYLDESAKQGILSIDTETTGLDPLLDNIVGLCIYTPSQKTAYVPINHISYITNERSTGQLTEEEVAEELNNLIDNHHLTIVMFNAKFDMRVIKNQLGVKNIYCDWDCYLAARVLNENEPSKGLKALHNKYCLDGKEDAFKFDDLFSGISFNLVPVKTGYLYAAHDAIITYELYEYQKKYLRLDHEREDMRNLAWLFHNIEMKCLPVVAEMEDTGVAFDFSVQERLSPKYHTKLDEALKKCYECVDEYADKIQRYKDSKSDHKLSDPINIGSPTQLSILLYDIIGVDVVDKKSPRGTGADILQRLNLPLCDAILEYRTIDKLIGTYIDKLPECVNPNDNRIHCSYNQYGADTGRFSSSDPNLQNIPSHNKDIRQMFKATNDETFVEELNQSFTIDKWCEVHTLNGWKSASSLCVGDILIVTENNIEQRIIVNKINEPVDNNQLILYY